MELTLVRKVYCKKYHDIKMDIDLNDLTLSNEKLKEIILEKLYNDDFEFETSEYCEEKYDDNDEYWIYDVDGMLIASGILEEDLLKTNLE